MNAIHNRQYITRKLHLTDLEYCLLVETIGYQWLERYFYDVPEVQKAASYSPLFWKWWVNQWDIRDKHFVFEVRFMCMPQSMLKNYYLEIHDAYKIHTRPNRLARIEISHIVEKIEYQKIGIEV